MREDPIMMWEYCAVPKDLQIKDELTMKMMEDSTGITFIMQGQQGQQQDPRILVKEKRYE